MNRAIVFLLIVLGSCSKKAEPEKEIVVSENIPVQQVEVAQEEDTETVPFSRSVKGNGFVYTLHGLEKANGSIDFKSISIFEKKKLRQKIIVDSVYVLHDWEIIFNADKDANFDGFKDLEVINWAGNYAFSSSFWLYNQKTRKYDHYKPLDTIQNIEIDAKRKEINSNYHIGPVNTYSKTYQWENGKLLMMSASIFEEGEETHMYRKNGKIVVE
ncbi:XAC2610-related protein [Chryseobacterium shigense]|uniref:Lipoprotein n=1 Tax=Chryseobacterium shigense TaxID=297244 RepID=A0A841NC75_9FLAO|nr:hypothetical protein [Chryseobacterium shigense]MBB6368959.1 hypothetical protein [Chryseobacterium shigense]